MQSVTVSSVLLIGRCLLNLARCVLFLSPRRGAHASDFWFPNYPYCNNPCCNYPY